jgi:exonuclease V gamma subunit
MDSKQEDRYIKRKKNDGEIPLANVAIVEINSKKEAVSQIRDKFLRHATTKEVPVNISVPIDNSVLSGRVSSVYGKTFVYYNVSKKNSQPKYLMEAWIKHLALTVIDENFETVFISSSYNFTIKSGYISQLKARDILTKLIKYFKKGHTEIVPFMINEAFGIKTNADYHSDYLKKEIEFGFDKDLVIGESLAIGDLIFDKTLIS